MTESDSKTKWCPMVIRSKAETLNRDACFDEGGTHCIGSACMMWRHESARNVPQSEGGPRVELSGHCGLASSPPMPLNFVGDIPPLRPRHKGVYNNPQPGDTDFPGG